MEGKSSSHNFKLHLKDPDLPVILPTTEQEQ